MQVVSPNFDRCRRVEERAPRQEKIPHRAECVEITSRRDQFGRRNTLWRNIVRSADAAPVTECSGWLVQLSNDAEVEHFDQVGDPRVCTQKYIGGFDVAVNEARGMCLDQCRCDLTENVDDTFWRQWARAGHDIFEVRALQKLHRIIKRTVWGSTIVEHGDRIWVRQGGRELYLAFESRERNPACKLGAKQFYCGGATKHCVPRAVDHPHRPFADFLVEHILPHLLCRANLFA